MVRGEPGYGDQVPRRQVYEAAHPNLEIIYLGAYWQAIIREAGGQTVITRYELKGSRDKLESLDDPAGPRPWTWGWIASESESDGLTGPSWWIVG